MSRIGIKSLAQHGHGGPSHYNHHDDDDHEEHIDERWLVSYADMMTLLFGLFVLLFSMSTLDPKTANQIKASAEETFKEKEEKPEQPPPPPDRTPELEARIKLLEEDLQTKAAALKESEEKLTETKEKDIEQAKKIEWLEDKLSKVPKPVAPKEEPPSREPELEAQLRKREREIEKLKAAREEAERKLASVSAEAPVAAEESQKLKEELDKMKQDLQAANQSAEEAKEKLKKEVESLNGGRGQDFMAFFINWATKDHDVDLVIQDPSGKVFDFKRREYKSHPGLFALDTRRGPGVELWQSKNILPGKYKATYSLYNDYGNSETAPVNAVILTPKGSFELPLSKLDVKGNRRATAEFEVDKNGGVRILNSGK